MNNSDTQFMNKYLKAIASAMVMFAMVLSAFAVPVSTAVAVTQTDSLFNFDSGFDFDFGFDFDTDFNQGDYPTNTETVDSDGSSSASSSSGSYTTCVLEASQQTITTGESITLTWDTSGFTSWTINGEALSSSSGTVTFEDIQANTTYVLEALSNSGSKCTAQAVVTCLPPPVPKYCELEVDKVVNKSTALPGEEVVYTITVKNTGETNCTGGGVKIEDVIDNNLSFLSYTLTSNLSAGYGSDPIYTSTNRTLHVNGNTLEPGESGTITWTGKINTPAQCGDFEVKNQAKATAKELNNFQTWVYSQTVKTAVDNDCGVPTPTCDSFTATPGTIMVGGKSTLAWETSNAVQVLINNAIGSVALDGSIEVSPLVDTTYVLTVIGAEDKTVSCEVPVTVSVDSVPVCESFTATPGTLPVGGGSVVLDWKVLGATGVTISPTVGTVGLVGSDSINVTESTTFTLTAIDADGDAVTCSAPVVVADSVPLSCANNVSFTASDTSITSGDEITLTWSTTNVDSVSISSIGATALSGSEKVSPSEDITYTLTATLGSETVNCPVGIDVTSDGGGGGGGGGSSSPRCDLDISDTKIEAGEEITLTWDTSSATEVTLTDDRGKVIFTTDDYLSNDKSDYYDGSIDLKPTRDTEYTLLAERGSRDKECKVEVNLEDSIVVLQTRDQQPLVAGISLSQVPYTGFEAGPFLTIMFYALLVAWSLYITYLLVVRNRVVASGDSLNVVTPNQEAMKKAETTRPDAFVAAAPVAISTPVNLPTSNPVIGYENHVEKEMVNPHQADDAVVTKLENRAHSQKALLSSDAVRHFIGTTTNEAERNEALDAVIAEAKKNYPLEDGWIVINELRMKNLCETCQVNSEAAKGTSFVPATVPEGSGSLAEAIVTGNVVAAYQMIGNRPMFALADAAADLDAVYRSRRGGTAQVSDMLIAETKDLSDVKIKSMIDALTGALDGIYTDEASAVKMAIMKAVKEGA